MGPPRDPRRWNAAVTIIVGVLTAQQPDGVFLPWGAMAAPNLPFATLCRLRSEKDGDSHAVLDRGASSDA
jgi:hypothetical protein